MDFKDIQHSDRIGKVIAPNSSVTASVELGDERYPHTCDCGEHTVAVGSKIRKLLADLTAQLIEQMYNKKDYTGTIGKMIVAEGLEFLTGLRSTFKTTSPYVGPDMLALQLMEYNLFEFSASKTESRLASMMRLLVDKDKQIRSFSDFKELCEKEMVKFNTRWLEAEYNLSVAVGQTSAQYLRYMAEKDSVTSFVKYQTAGDNKVRDSHRVLNGRIFSLDDKEAMDLFPPNGFGCRCEMVQFLGKPDNVTKGSIAKKAIETTDPRYKGSQFEINRGDLKQVFTKKQFYSDTKGLPEKLNQMTFDKYGLKKWEEFKQDLNPIVLDKTITGDNIKELFKPHKKTNYMGFEDYLGRKTVLKKSTFDTHTKGYYLEKEELRHQLFPHIKEILKNPDEVWYFDYKNNGRKFQPRYVKFYQDRVLIIDCDLDTDKHSLEVKTWYTMKASENTIRKGLKIK